jgi:hypothetical protein
VRDGVVHLARDPEPFLIDPGTGLFLAGSLRQLGALQRFGSDEFPRADALAKGGTHDRGADPEEHPADGGRWFDVGGRDQPAWRQGRDPHPGRHQRTAPVAEGRQRVDGHEQPEPSGPVREIEGVIGQAGERGRDEHRDRPAAAHHHDGATGDQQQVAQIPKIGQRAQHRFGVPVGAGDGALDLHHHDEQRQQHVLRPGRRAEQHGAIVGFPG